MTYPILTNGFPFAVAVEKVVLQLRCASALPLFFRSRDWSNSHSELVSSINLLYETDFENFVNNNDSTIKKLRILPHERASLTRLTALCCVVISLLIGGQE